MFNFQKLSTDIVNLSNQNQFIEYLEYNFSDIEKLFNNLSFEQVQELMFDIEDLLYDILDSKLIGSDNNQIVNAFLILLAEKFMQNSLIGAMTIINNYIPESAVKTRLQASILYLKINDIRIDYLQRSEQILTMFEDSARKDDYSIKNVKSFFYFIKSVFLQFNRTNNSLLAESFLNNIKKLLPNYNFTKNQAIEKFILNSEFNNLNEIILKVNNFLFDLEDKNTICSTDKELLSIEESTYSNILYSLSKPSFNSIRNEAYKYLQSIGDPEELYYNLQRGEKIIDDEKLLYKYLVSYGGKHKEKLFSAYDEIIDSLKNEKFNVIDWGCGQATATMLLLEYARSKNIFLDIETIVLIEPSSLAIRRGLLHIEVLKQKEYKISAFNSDLDCLNEKDIKINNKHKILNLFSNILDIDSFSLDTSFFNKVAYTMNNENIFVCISPNRNDKHNHRLEIFYEYFDENFDTKLISSRSDTINNATRYEKIFTSNEIEPTVEIVEEINTIEKKVDNNLSIIEDLVNYKNYLTPVIDIKILNDSITDDPEYAIFKIRKVAEVITTKIYIKFEDNERTISFNDKIRYLAYEKKVFDKTITNYVQTIRTIGNRGVHESNRDISKLKLDAILMSIALLSFLNEVEEKKLIN